MAVLPGSNTRVRSDNTTAIAVQLDTSPVAELLKKIRDAGTINVEDALENRILPKVMGELAQKIQPTAPVDRGLLQKAIQYKIVRYDDNNVVVALVGVRQEVHESITRRSRKNVDARIAQTTSKQRGYKKGDVLRKARIIGEDYTINLRPSKYFHLVEFGHALKGGKGVQPGTNFFQNALQANKSQAMETFRAELTALYEEAIQ